MDKEKAGNLVLSLLSFLLSSFLISIIKPALTHTYGHEELSFETTGLNTNMFVLRFYYALLTNARIAFFSPSREMSLLSLLHNTRLFMDLYAGMLHVVFF
ncbi:MAG: hypothetical protein JOS17DRAFT_591853 [Linnemannia elongata]|nr:MAG: hypothetical protein JOS17DRAFT_591853 [Linnemannia elongata]